MTTIITNNIPRDILYGYDLTREELDEFDYLDADEIGCHAFFKYRGWVYDLGDFMVSTTTWISAAGCVTVNNPLLDWDGYFCDSHFSRVVVKYVEETFEKVIVGRQSMDCSIGQQVMATGNSGRE